MFLTKAIIKGDHIFQMVDLFFRQRSLMAAQLMWHRQYWDEGLVLELVP